MNHRNASRGFLRTLVVGAVTFVTVWAAVLGATYALFWILGRVTADVPLRVLTIAVLLACTTASTSLSGAMRAFWTSIPGTYCFVCIAHALGFWGALAYLGVGTLLTLPHLALLRLDD